MIRFFAAHPTAANLFMGAFFVLGLVSLPELRRETFPRIEPRNVQVTAPFPGASAEEVEEAVCQRIEDSIDKVDNVAEVTCESLEGMASAVAEMMEGRDFDLFFTDVKSEVEAISTFPDKVEKPIVKQLGRTDFVASVAITGPTRVVELKAYAEDVKDRMLQWKGISQVAVKGFSQHQVRIEISDATLRQFGLSVEDIADTVARQSVDLPSGSIEAKEQEILVRFADERKSVGQFASLVVVSGAEGGEVLLGDIATITDRFDLDEDKVLYDGKRAALLEVTKTETEDTLNAIDALKAFVANENAIAPPGVALNVTNDGSSIVRDRLNLLSKNGVMGLTLVFAAMWLFFGFRFSFWVAMGLPVSFFGAFALILFFDFSINMLTMVGLLIAIGILMDDAIVISENVATHRQKGKSPLDAAVEGARQVMPSVLASFITTVCVFGSLIFLKGDMGAVLRMVPIVMLFVLSVSLIEAFFILPAHLHHSMEHLHGNELTGLRGKVDRWLENFRENRVGRLADLAVRWRYLTAGIAVGALIISIAMPVSGILKFSAFPELEGDVVEARILLPQGTPLPRTELVVDHVVEAIRSVDEELSPSQPNAQRLVKAVSLQFNKNKDAYESGPHIATVTVDLLGAETRTSNIDEVMAAWKTAIGSVPDVLAIKLDEPAIGPAGLAIDIRLLGNDLDQLKQASMALQDWIGRYKGVTSLLDDLRPGKPEVRVRLKDGASTLGIDARMIASQLRAAFFGSTASEIQVGPESYDIDVRLRPEDRDSLADLDYFVVTSKEGSQIPLSVVAEVEEGRGWARINRVNGRRAVTLQGDIDVSVANANEIIKDTQKRFLPELIKRYPGVEVSLEGQDKNTGTTQKSMLRGFLIGLTGVFVLLSFQFKSYLEPIIVMMAIPLSLIGVIWGHLIMGLELTMPSMLGFVSLAGVVVNNSILLVVFTKVRHAEGMSLEKAATTASRGRFRAIFLTSITTVVGLLPMLAETSLQAQILIPLVTSLAFGMIASTVMVLFVIPSVYMILDDLGLTTIARSKKAAAREVQEA